MSQDSDSTDPENGSTSENLVERARQGRDSAYASLFRRHFPFLIGYVRGKVPRWRRALSDSQDLAQNALIRVFAGLPRFQSRGRGALRAYLRRTVDNLIRDEFRRIGRRGAVVDLNTDAVDSRPSVHDELVAADTEDRFRRALARLKPVDRQLVVGRMKLGYSFEQLAEVTGKASADAARVALKRALQLLAAEMNGERSQ